MTEPSFSMPAEVLDSHLGREIETSMFRFAVMLVVAVSASSPLSAQEPDADALLAGVLMRNGLLCSQVVDKRPSDLPNKIQVTCIQYRGGRAQVRYILDVSTGKAVKAE
jgi:hypothetical protein